jgi:hypothetical protein
MRLFYFTFFLILNLTKGDNVFCHTLLKRSIAKGQPFQLPMDVDNPYACYMDVSYLREEPWNMTLHAESRWLYVEKHNLNHVQLLKAFRC